MKSYYSYFIMIFAFLPFSCSHSILLEPSLSKSEKVSHSVARDSLSFSEENFKEEIEFSTADKIGSIIVGAIIGYGVGVVSGLVVGGYIERPYEHEGYALVPYAYVGGGLGAICGSIFFYRINEKQAKKKAINKLQIMKNKWRQENEK